MSWKSLSKEEKKELLGRIEEIAKKSDYGDLISAIYRDGKKIYSPEEK